MKPIHNYYNFSYRNIYPYLRNYEALPTVQIIQYVDILEEMNLFNDFLKAYIEYNHDTSKIKEFWDQWDNIRKKEIHTLIYNGALQNLFLIKKSYLTNEYFKLLAWAYSPLPPHIITKE